MYPWNFNLQIRTEKTFLDIFYHNSLRVNVRSRKACFSHTLMFRIKFLYHDDDDIRMPTPHNAFLSFRLAHFVYMQISIYNYIIQYTEYNIMI